MGYSAFFSGLSGLRAHESAIEVIGNNLANVNTVGFKSSRANFSDFFNVSSGRISGSGSANQVGGGAGPLSVQQLFHQGSLQPTEVETDLAIQGAGFFNMRTPEGTAVYSRAGNFFFDNEGYMVDPNGNRLQGYNTRDAAGHIVPTGALGDIRVSQGTTAPPEVTSYFQMHMNLNATDDPGDTWNPSVPIHDRLGGQHLMNLLFTAVDSDSDGATDSWSYEISVDASEVASPSGSGPSEVIATGTLTFDGNGQLTAPTGNVTLTLPAWANGAAGQDIDWQLYNDQNDPVITGYASNTEDTALSVDGYGVGRLHSLSITDAGLIQGVFTNGQTLELSQISMVSFNNPDGLFRRGDNTYLASVGSGAPSIGTAQSGGRGAIVAKALELSNVDITEQFTQMIVAERGYQSNSRVLTTADEILQETLSIKR